MNISALAKSVSHIGRNFVYNHYSLWRSIALELKLDAVYRRKGGGHISVTLPDFPHPICIRRSGTDVATFKQIFFSRDYETSGMEQDAVLNMRYRSLVDSGARPCIVDCGANIGLSSIWFANRYKEATVYAVEPDRDNFEILKINAAVYGNIVPLHAGVWDSPCDLEITNKDADCVAYRTGEIEVPANKPSENSIRGMTIHQILGMANSRSAFLVKIDIEGAESSLFRSNTDWFSSVEMVAIELHDWMLPG